MTPLEISLPRSDTRVTLRFEASGFQAVEREIKLARDVTMQVDLPVIVTERNKPVPPPQKTKGKVSQDGVVDPFAPQ